MKEREMKKKVERPVKINSKLVRIKCKKWKSNKKKEKKKNIPLVRTGRTKDLKRKKL